MEAFTTKLTVLEPDIETPGAPDVRRCSAVDAVDKPCKAQQEVRRSDNSLYSWRVLCGLRITAEHYRWLAGFRGSTREVEA